MMDFLGNGLFGIGLISMLILIAYFIHSFLKKKDNKKNIGKALLVSVLVMILGLELSIAYSIRSFIGSVLSMIGSILMLIFIPLTIYYFIRKREKVKKAGLILLASVFIIFAGSIVDDTPQSVKDMRAAEVSERKAEKAAKKAEELAEKEAEELAVIKAEELEAKKASDLEKKEAEELEAKKAKEVAEQKKKALIKSTYDNAVGKTPLQTSQILKENGFDAKFIHETTKNDLTSSIEFNSDPKDKDSYIPFIITKLDSFDENGKVASFYINTNENIAAAEASKNLVDNLSAKLSPSVAWGTFNTYGDNNFPYGFKLNIARGMLAERPLDENTWFLKATCEIKNINGVWIKNLECEAEVTGTTEAPKVINFNYY